MKSYEQIARDNNASIDDVRAAAEAAERITVPVEHIPADLQSDGCPIIREETYWLVNSRSGRSYADPTERLGAAFGFSRTREEAIERALQNGFSAKHR